ncbi:MAG: AAA family ATPase [Gemmataceae bacterium]|nr:AAA family ATPase [Gemmataceae bacterium]
MYTIIFDGAQFLCKLLCNSFTLPEAPMNTESQPLSSEPFAIQPLRPSELADAEHPHLSWLWQGYLAPGKVTALISPPKSGKTTLVSHLLARCAQGGQLAGLAVAPGRALVVSEEMASDWDARCRQLALGQNVQFLCRPFKGARPTEARWFALVASLEALQRREGLDLVVIDALAALLPGYAEMFAPKLLDCLLPLQALANRGSAMWLLHHPAKGKRADGQTARGSGALSGFADIVMEMSCCRRARSRDRRRRICAYSRYSETPRHLILELNADGSDYLVRTDATGVPLVRTWPEVYSILARATDRLSQQNILERWPDEQDPPDRSTLSRWLKRATQQGVICCSGTGYRGDGFRYWLPSREPLLWPGNHASEEEKQAWRDRCAAHYRSLREQQASA